MKQIQTMGADESPRRMCWFRRYRRQHYAREWLLLLFFLNIFLERMRPARDGRQKLF